MTFVMPVELSVFLQDIWLTRPHHCSKSTYKRHQKRDEVDDFLNSLGDEEGTQVDIVIGAAPVEEPSSSSSPIPESSSAAESSQLNQPLLNQLQLNPLLLNLLQLNPLQNPLLLSLPSS